MTILMSFIIDNKMGIKNLSKLVKPFIRQCDLSLLKGLIFAVDANLLLYQYLEIAKSATSFMMNVRNFIHRMSLAGIKLIFVFDGKAPVVKEYTLKKRNAVAHNVYIELSKTVMEFIIEYSKTNNLAIKEEITGDYDKDFEIVKNHVNENDVFIKYAPIFNIDRISRTTVTNMIMALKDINKNIYNKHMGDLKKILIITDGILLLIKQLLYHLGVEQYTAEGESDKAIKRLYMEHYIHGVISKDYDMLANGIEIIVQSYADTVDMYILSEVVHGLKFTKTFQPKTKDILAIKDAVNHSLVKEDPDAYKQFVELCVLCGCDYTQSGIKGIGCINANKLIAKYKSIDNFIDDYKDKYDPTGFDYKTAIKEFMSYDIKYNSIVFEKKPTINDLYESFMMISPEDKERLDIKLMDTKKEVAKVNKDNSIMVIVD